MKISVTSNGGLKRFNKRIQLTVKELNKRINNANNRAGVAVRTLLTDKGETMFGLTRGDTKRRIRAYYRRTRHGDASVVRATFIIHELSARIDAARLKHPAKTGALKRAPKGRGGASVRVTPGNRLVVVPRKADRKHRPKTKIFFREDGEKRAATVDADFRDVLKRNRRQALSRYRRVALRELNLAGLLRRGR